MCKLTNLVNKQFPIWNSTNTFLSLDYYAEEGFSDVGIVVEFMPLVLSKTGILLTANGTRILALEFPDGPRPHFHI